MAADRILAIDQGTSGSTALIIDEATRVVASVTVEFPNHYPAPGHVEHDVREIAASVEAAVRGVLAKANLPPTRIAAIGITNQRETSLFWDKTTGEPIHRALVWQDRRTADLCAAMKAEGLEPLFKERTGLVLDPYFSGTKARWLLDHVPGARAKATAGELYFGTIDTWLAWWLTGEHVTDASNASRTLMFDLHRLDWDDELLGHLRVPRAALPRIVDSAQIVGYTKGVAFLPDGIPVAGLIGDQQGALFGQTCFQTGMAKCTYGTGAFILMNTGDVPVASSRGMLTTVAWRLNGKATYALEGSAFVAGQAVQWLRDNLGILSSSAEVETLAASVPDSGGVTFVPAMAGLGAPHWRPHARGIITGISGGTNKAHIARAVLDGVALQLVDILEAMTHDLRAPLTELRVDGGASANNLLMQRQADLLGVPCVRPKNLETTGLGSALLAGIAVGIWSSTDDVVRSWEHERRFEPHGDAGEINATRRRWAAAVEKA